MANNLTGVSYKWPLMLLMIFLVFSAPLIADAQSATGATRHSDWLDLPLTDDDARHLISRTGLGVSLPELLAVRGMSRREAIDHLIDGFLTTESPAMPAWTRDTSPVFWARQDLSEEGKRRFDRTRDSELAELRQWWIDSLLTTRSPQTERMVLFWHDHFATSYHAINRQSIAMARQNQTFRSRGMGDFRTLLKAMLRDPALLNYLDNLSNRKASPNENLARELLELFTLGEGNYPEHTVKEAARALTGFNVAQNKNLSFEYQTWSHDTGLKNLFGQTGFYDSDDLVDLILKQYTFAPFIAKKFWYAFISDHEPTDADIATLVNAFTTSQFNITALYRATLESNAFWAEHNRASLVKSPVQLIIGFARSLEYPKSLNHQIPSLLARSGMDLFAPPNVAGWTEGAAWITSGRLLNRYHAIGALEKHNSAHAPETMSGKSEMSMNMASSNNMMMQTPDNLQSLKLQLAGEDYDGPVNYRVELLDLNNKTVWDSGDKSLPGGHDTKMYGRIRSAQDLPWQTVQFNVDKSTASQAQFLRVHFLNDAGGDDGDRNLFFNGAAMGEHWIDSANGKQNSKCPPGSSADAGNLYCNGAINLPLQLRSSTTHSPDKSPGNKNIKASSVHMHWIRWQPDNKKLDVTLTLQNLQAEHEFYPVFSFHLKSTNGQEPQLELNTVGCWPDCVEQWPDCAWTDSIDPSRKTLVFPMSGAGKNKDYQCHYSSINQPKKNLIKQLMRGAPALMESAFATHREFHTDQKLALSQWQKLFNNLNQQNYNQSSSPLDFGFDIDKKWQRDSPPRQPPTTLEPEIHSIAELDAWLKANDVTLSGLLLPGIDPKTISGFGKLAGLPASEQLQILVRSPAFQLH